MHDKFKGLCSIAEAVELFGRTDSTLRWNITNGKFVEEEDVKKFGKTWIFRIEALEREYGKLEKR